MKLLIVDDDSSTLKILKKGLSRYVDEILVANDGKEALLLFEKEQPSIVVTDVLMPKLNGVQLIKEIKEISPSTKIVAMSAYSNEKNLIELINLQLDFFLLKPFRMDSIRDILFELFKKIRFEVDRDQRYKLLIESSDDGIWELNHITNSIFCSYKFIKNLGLDSSDVEFSSLRSFERFVHIDDIDKFSLCLSLIESEEVSSYEIDFRFDCGDARYEWVHFRIKQLLSDDGSKLRTIIFNQNITDKKRQEEALFIHSKYSTLGEMIANIAHQWRQPLNALSVITCDMYYNYENSELSKEDMDEFYQESNSIIQSMSKTIDDFRNLFEVSKMLEPFSVNSSIHSAIVVIGSSLKHSKIDLKLSLEENLIGFGKQNELTQSILVLLNNAKDQLCSNRDGDREILLKAYGESGRVRVEIEDNGGGVDLSIRDKIFDPYFTTKHKSEGTGLGLYMTKMIVQNSLKGDIYFKNIEGGARFTIELDRYTKQDSSYE